jgi:dynein heavy chain
VNIHGLFIQGAKWDWPAGHFIESEPGELFSRMPVIWLQPVRNEDAPTDNIYNTPLYKTSLRWGVLSTTGHSTNFILYIDLNTQEPAEHWIRRGVALLCQLDD